MVGSPPEDRKIRYEDSWGKTDFPPLKYDDRKKAI